MNVTIITTYYQGSRFMEHYLRMIDANRMHLKEGQTMDVIIINDSPEEEIPVPEGRRDIRVINNASNIGIHASRIRGLHEAAGPYVIFLDQDDLLTDNAITTFLDFAEEHTDPMEGRPPVIVANAYLEQEDGSRLVWYRTAYHKRLVGYYRAYLEVGTQIISPGQCMLDKDAIPTGWTEKPLHKNGSDDYYLWLLLLAKGTPFLYLDQILYIHSYTGGNLSDDTSRTDASSMEFLERLKNVPYFSNDDVEMLTKMLHFKARFRRGGLVVKGAEALAHPYLFSRNVVYKKRTATPLGFNRRR